jgi:hypothetical protein
MITYVNVLPNRYTYKLCISIVDNCYNVVGTALDITIYFCKNMYRIVYEYTALATLWYLSCCIYNV